MPCRYPESEGDDNRKLHKELDILTRMICEQCKQLEEEFDYKRLITPELKAWWNVHKAQDVRRKKEEDEENELERQEKLTLYKQLKQELGL